MSGADQGRWPAGAIPSSWEWIPFEDAFEHQTSGTLKLQQKDYLDAGELPVVDQGQKAIAGYTDRVELAYGGPLPAIVFGDHTRVIKYVDARFVQGADGIKVLAPCAVYDPLFATYALRTLRLPDKGYARHFKFLTASRFPLPPLPEQRRIVARIEALTARSHRAKEALDAIPPLLEKFRHSVLASAFRGELTREWRERNGDLESGAMLLDRLRRDRRQRWQELMAQRGRRADSSKYSEPPRPDASTLPALPASWAWGTWDMLSEWITYGFTRPMPHLASGAPIVTAKNVINGRIDFENTHKTDQASFDALSDKDRPRRGDILITKDGTLGRVSVVDTDSPFCINQSVAVIWMRGSPMSRDYLAQLIESPLTQKPILEAARGMAIQHLSITDFGRLPVPIPPLREQNEIAKRLHDTLGAVDGLMNRVSLLRDSADQLDRSILTRAFAGTLVPQDPADEPASALLERIRAERAAASSDAPSGRRSGTRIKPTASASPGKKSRRHAQ